MDRVDPTILELEDLDGDALAWARGHGVRAGDVVVLRPDRVVFAVVPSTRAAAATSWLASELGLPPRRALQQAATDRGAT